MELLTVDETANKLRMSQAWIRQLIFQKKIKYFKIGRRVFIPSAAIEEILEKSVVEPRGKNPD